MTKLLIVLVGALVPFAASAETAKCKAKGTPLLQIDDRDRTPKSTQASFKLYPNGTAIGVRTREGKIITSIQKCLASDVMKKVELDLRETKWTVKDDQCKYPNPVKTTVIKVDGKLVFTGWICHNPEDKVVEMLEDFAMLLLG